jgi:putative ABC transport system substrate-binding protein
MRRRDVLTLLGGAAVVWPLTAPAQQSGRVRRIGVLMPTAEDDPQSQARLVALQQGLEKRGWAIGRDGSDRLPLEHRQC